MAQPFGDDLDLRDFNNVCRLFPLPDIVQFPHSILPLHIFEPRYRQMTEDALAGDRLVTIVRVPQPAERLADGRPRIAEVACLGRIIDHTRLPDGRFNFLLLGRKRVRLHAEIATKKLYRMAEAEILDDLEPDDPQELTDMRIGLIGLFRELLERTHRLDPELDRLIDSELPMGVLSDVVAHALGLPVSLKQSLLAEPRVDVRVAQLVRVMRTLARGEAEGLRRFPPGFSPN